MELDSQEERFKVYCSSCGLEILPDQNYSNEFGTNDFYHDAPMVCYAYRNVGWF